MAEVDTIPSTPYEKKGAAVLAGVILGGLAGEEINMALGLGEVYEADERIAQVSVDLGKTEEVQGQLTDSGRPVPNELEELAAAQRGEITTLEADRPEYNEIQLYAVDGVSIIGATALLLVAVRTIYGFQFRRNLAKQPR